ncbi:alpha/beta hydrolase [Roseovarius sp. 2305UL8-3]|uniref:alpha/beta hydrolase n=1 Tax=Roseovarius conchicola TaxID=3121636 RepID=UPI0035298ED2
MVKLLLVIALLGDGLFFGLGRFERNAVYPFDATRVAPARMGLSNMTEMQLRSGIQTLIIWVSPPRAGKPTILYFHGNAGNLANRAGRFTRFTNRGYGVIAPAYRGSSGSTGRPSEAALTRDATLVWAEMGTLIPGLTPRNTVVYGESLGTGVALKLLAQPGNPQPAAVILEAPFTSLPEVVQTTYPQLEPLIERMKNIWNSRDHARSLHAPLLVLHGSEDALIPIDMGRQVFAIAPSKEKRFLAVSGAGHTDIWRSDVLPQIWSFIDATSGR